MNITKYPDEMLIVHFQAQIDRILDYDLGSIVSNAEYRGLGKTSSIAHRVFCNLIDAHRESDLREQFVIVPSSEIQDTYIDIINKKLLLHGLVLPNATQTLLKKIILVADSSTRGIRFTDEDRTQIVYLDGVNKRVFKDVIEPSCVGKQVVFRGFVKL